VLGDIDLDWSLDEKIDAEFLGLDSDGQVRIALFFCSASLKETLMISALITQVSQVQKC